MSNLDFMKTLDAQTFEEAMHSIYFGGMIKNGSTPSYLDVIVWLNDDCANHQVFWGKVLRG